MPQIPNWIRSFRYQDFTNVFEILPDVDRLYATETLFGDWEGRVLLLAKNAAPAHVIEALSRTEGDAAWRHAQRRLGDTSGWKTNERLSALVEQHLTGVGCLYGSAAAHLMSNDQNWSRRLPELHNGALEVHLIQVLRWVLREMHKVEAIACLGEDAWRMACNALDQNAHAGQSRLFRNRGEPLELTCLDKSIVLTSHYHPAARVSSVEMQRGWVALSAFVQRKAV